MTELEKALYADVCWLREQLELKMNRRVSLVPHAAAELHTTLTKYVEYERHQELHGRRLRGRAYGR